MKEESYWDVAEDALSWDNRAFQRLAAEAAEVGRKQQLSAGAFRNGIHQLYDAYYEFLSGVNSFDLQTEDYAHWHNHFSDARLNKKWGRPALHKELLSGAAYKYLRGTLRVPMFDRGLIDAMIAQETLAFIDAQAGQRHFLTIFGVFAVPIAFVWGYQSLTSGPEADLASYWHSILALFLVMLALWALPRWGAFALHRQMKDTYQLMTGSVVSVSELRHRVERARDRGVVWPAELYALLDDVASRTKIL